MGACMICPDITTDLLSAVQLLKHGNRVAMHAGTHPYMTITTNSQDKIVVPVSGHDQFELPHRRIQELMHQPRSAIRQGSAYGPTTPDTDENSSDDGNNMDTTTPNTLIVDNSSTPTTVITPTPVTDTPQTAMVSNNMQTREEIIYTKEQRLRSEQVRILHDNMHCSDESLKLALTNGLIIGTGLTAQDIDTYRRIYGPCLACMAGKVTKPSYRQPSEEPPATRVAQVIHTDLLKLEAPIIGNYMQQLFSVDEFSGNKHLNTMKNKSAAAVTYAFCDLISYYKRHGWIIHTIVCDSESVLKAARVYLGHQGIQLMHTPPHQHAQRCERHIRTMKDRARTMTAAIPYVLPLHLYGELYRAACHHLNSMPNKHANTTPSMQVENRKLDLTRTHKVPFGTVIQIHTPKQPNNSYPRGEIGIVLGPNAATYNAVDTYAIYSKKVIVRHQYTVYKHIPKDFPYPLHNLPTTTHYPTHYRPHTHTNACPYADTDSGTRHTTSSATTHRHKHTDTTS
jgi:hypothetical protein